MTVATTGFTRPDYVFFGAIGGLLIALAFVLYNMMGVGHAAFNTTSMGVVWGLPIIVYDYFLLTSTGLVFIASLSLVFGIKVFEPIAKRCVWLALAGLTGGVAVLFLELGYPIRALLLTPFAMQTSSPLFWKILLVGLYTALLLLVTLRLHFMRGTAGVRLLSVPLFLAAVGITLVAGSLYGLMSMRPFWFGGEIPVVFLIESFMGGIAFAIFFTFLAHGFTTRGMPDDVKSLFGGVLGQLFAVAIFLHLLFVSGRAITGLYSNAEGLQVWDHIVASPLFHAALWGGIVLPLVLMMVPGLRRQGPIQLLAATLVMLSLFVSRYEFVIGGQLVPLFKGSWAPPLLSYVPSPTEWALLLVGVFLANVVNAFGEWKLDLEWEGHGKG
ncbi:MAG: polysulfide reductase [Geminicoccaceae bacterium]|nr:MAG: polysulfide reductase [Geminicoccaceae bacterium]